MEIDWRNRDADVQCRLRPARDAQLQNWDWRIRTYDGMCNNASFGDEDQSKNPSRHVVITLALFGFQVDLQICVTLLPSQEGPNGSPSKRSTGHLE